MPGMTLATTAHRVVTQETKALHAGRREPAKIAFAPVKVLYESHSLVAIAKPPGYYPLQTSYSSRPLAWLNLSICDYLRNLVAFPTRLLQ
jgi:hypothetical protein